MHVTFSGIYGILIAMLLKQHKNIFQLRNLQQPNVFMANPVNGKTYQ